MGWDWDWDWSRVFMIMMMGFKMDGIHEDDIMGVFKVTFVFGITMLGYDEMHVLF